MKALRIILTQNQANYKKEEIDINKCTYPLPPVSTVIGALHVACNFDTYHPMEISIQGNYESLNRKIYRDQIFLNSLQNDRGDLVKLSNFKYMSTSYLKVAHAKNSQGNDFEKEITIDVLDRDGLVEYQRLKKEKKEIDQYKKGVFDVKISEYKADIKKYKEVLKITPREGQDYEDIKSTLKIIEEEKRNFESQFKAKQKEWEQAYEKFATVTTSIKSYEILHNIQLILHIQSDNKTLEQIEKNVYNIRSIGRSEDFVDIISCDVVELDDEIDDVRCTNSAYVRVENVREEIITVRGDNKAQGTKYYLNKDYIIEDNKRKFNKKWVLYISEFDVELEKNQHNSGVYIDQDGYIVNFI